MEIRKVQVTGGSSYVITLPKEWVKSMEIQKNDPVGLIAQPDGTLLITPKPSGERRGGDVCNDFVTFSAWHFMTSSPLHKYNWLRKPGNAHGPVEWSLCVHDGIMRCSHRRTASSDASVLWNEARSPTSK